MARPQCADPTPGPMRPLDRSRSRSEAPPSSAHELPGTRMITPAPAIVLQGAPLRGESPGTDPRIATGSARCAEGTEDPRLVARLLSSSGTAPEPVGPGHTRRRSGHAHSQGSATGKSASCGREHELKSEARQHRGRRRADLYIDAGRTEIEAHDARDPTRCAETKPA